jgi:uncharacterized protein (DUF58 family)
VDRSELLRRIAAFPLRSAQLAEDLLSGGFRSVFKGNGIEFDEVRRYEAGDDVRSIDRNVSARFGTPYIKLYREERELCVFVMVDCSASMFSGGCGELSRYEQAVITAALVAFSAERAGQRVGALFFDNGIRGMFKPRRGRAHTMALLSSALDAVPRGQGTALGGAIQAVCGILKRRCLVVLVSDFLAADWERDFGALCAKHDCIAIRLKDVVEDEFPALGLVPVVDAETGKSILAASASPTFKAAWQDWQEGRRQLWSSICKSQGAAALEISTEDNAALCLQRFFRSRRVYTRNSG